MMDYLYILSRGVSIRLWSADLSITESMRGKQENEESQRRPPNI